MTIAEKTKATANASEPIPLLSPMDAVNAVTNAECALGMPPADKKYENPILRSRIEYKTSLKIWQASWTATETTRLMLMADNGFTDPVYAVPAAGASISKIPGL